MNVLLITAATFAIADRIAEIVGSIRDYRARNNPMQLAIRDAEHANQERRNFLRVQCLTMHCFKPGCTVGETDMLTCRCMCDGCKNGVKGVVELYVGSV